MMLDHDALLAAITREPDEDTPRLAFADYLEEYGESERAAFIRMQIELARIPPWEPAAVERRWRQPELVSGARFLDTLPPVDGFHVEWHAEPFRRGFGWRLNIRSLLAWEELEARVLARAPVGEVHFWGADTLDQWRAFADSPLIPLLRRVHFVANPIEPIRVLRETPAALGIRDIHFQRASGAGMPVVIEELLGSPLGRAVRGLHFHMGYQSLEDLIDALNLSSGLERLSLATMGLTDSLVERLFAGPCGAELTELDLRGNPLGREGTSSVAARLPLTVESLGLAATGAGGRGLAALAERANNLRRLDLSSNFLAPRAIRALARSAHLDRLRSLNLRMCGISNRHLNHLIRAGFWPNLVELDLRENPIGPAAARQLLDAAIPPDLTVLALDGEPLGPELQRVLTVKFRGRIVFG